VERNEVIRVVAGSLIEDARYQAGLSQEALARKAGTSQSSIAAYESGGRQPTLPTLYRILEAAGYEPRIRLVVIDPQDLAQREWEDSRPDDEIADWAAAQDAFVHSRA